jgi:hypothetical protein
MMLKTIDDAMHEMQRREKFELVEEDENHSLPIPENFRHLLAMYPKFPMPKRGYRVKALCYRSDRGLEVERRVTKRPFFLGGKVLMESVGFSKGGGIMIFVHDCKFDYILFGYLNLLVPDDLERRIVSPYATVGENVFAMYLAMTRPGVYLVDSGKQRLNIADGGGAA